MLFCLCLQTGEYISLNVQIQGIMKVTFGKMTEFKREVDIVNDSTKVKGNVAVSDGNIMSVDNGVVLDGDGNQIATFSQYSTENLNVNYNTSDLQKMIDAVTNINTFSAYVKEHVDELSDGIASGSVVD